MAEARIASTDPGAIAGGVRQALAHDSAVKHVSGAAAYVDDIPELPGTVQVLVGMSARAHARIKSLDLDAVRAAPGIVTVLSAADVPGIKMPARSPVMIRYLPRPSSNMPASRSSQSSPKRSPRGARRSSWRGSAMTTSRPI